MDIADDNLSKLVRSSTGPAPWYWETFPSPTGASGKKYVWRFHPQGTELAFLVTLHLPDELDRPRLALNTHCRPFLINSDTFGVWCPEGRNLRFVAFDPDSLKPFDFVEIAGWFKSSSERIYATTPPISEFSLPTTLGEGTHSHQFPSDFESMTELLVANALPSTAADDPSAAVFVLYPHAALMEVLPQKWFTPRQYKLGQQWISRVTRDPETHRIVGECVRVGLFELTDDGNEVRKWIEKEES
jgi:hypothetical protein